MHMTVKQALAQRPQEELLEAATALADADLRMRRALVGARRAAGLSQNDVAEALGIKQSSVAAFERYDNDPRLSTIRRYALAVGAQVSHDVTPFSFGSGWRSVATPMSASLASSRAGASLEFPAPSGTKRVHFSLAA